MSRIPNVADLVLETREQADELNTAAKSDDAIVRIMNRGLRFVADQLAKSWEEPLVARIIYSPSLYNRDIGFPLPDDIFEDRVTLVSVDTPAAPTQIAFRDYSQVQSLLIKGSRSFIPVACFIKGRFLFLAPQPGAAYNILIDYVRLPDPFVFPIGRITAVSLVGDSVSMDPTSFQSHGSAQISTDQTSNAAYVNLVDGMTGVIKATRQVQLVQGSQVQFRAAPTRTEVEGRAVTGPFSTQGPFDPLTGASAVEIGDYLCPVDGSCVPQWSQMLTTYVVDYSVAAIGRSLGDTTAAITKAIADRGEQAARQQRAGRPNILRVKNKSKVWGVIRPSAYPYVPS